MNKMIIRKLSIYEVSRETSRIAERKYVVNTNLDLNE